MLEAAVSRELVELGLWVGREYCSTPARGLELVLPPGTGRVRAGHGAEARAACVRLTEAAPRRSASGRRSSAAKQAAALGLLDRARGRGRRAATLREHAGVAARDDPQPREARPRRGRGGRGLAPPGRGLGRARPARPRLNPAQAAAVERVVGALDGEGSELLLHGVTGSGKTEVYLAAAEAAVERGSGVIVLVPEIGLTPQTVARFRARFGERVAVLHSRLSAGERRDEWERLRRGEARICVGPRSAVFAPIAGLGLIVVDEEHDSSYKQESDPRYDAREVARRRAAQTGSVLLAGSATPRPESWLALPRIELPERADGAPLPPVELLDMRERDGRQGPLHPRARERPRRARREPAARRSSSSPAAAGRRTSAAASAVTRGAARSATSRWSYHREAGRLRCHHCGHSEPLPSRCPECGSVDDRPARGRQRAGGGDRRGADRRRCR